MSRRSPQAWRLEEQDDGEVDVYLGRRRVRIVADLDEALSFVRPRYQDGQTVVHVDTDGHETKMTKQIARR